MLDEVFHPAESFIQCILCFFGKGRAQIKSGRWNPKGKGGRRRPLQILMDLQKGSGAYPVRTEAWDGFRVNPLKAERQRGFEVRIDEKAEILTFHVEDMFDLKLKIREKGQVRGGGEKTVLAEGFQPVYGFRPKAIIPSPGVSITQYQYSRDVHR